MAGGVPRPPAGVGCGPARIDLAWNRPARCSPPPTRSTALGLRSTAGASVINEARIRDGDCFNVVWPIRWLTRSGPSESRRQSLVPGFPQNVKMTLTVEHRKSNISSLWTQERSIPGWCIAPPAFVCKSLDIRPTAAMDCCVRPVTYGRGCWTATGSGSGMGCRRSSAIRRCAANSPYEDPPESCRRSGPAPSRQRPSRVVGAAGPPHSLSRRASPSGHAARRWGAAVARSHRSRPHPAATPRSGSGGWGGSWHHPSLRGRCRRGSLASVGPGDSGRELPAPARPAGPPREGCEAGTQARPEGVAALAPSPAPRAA